MEQATVNGQAQTFQRGPKINAPEIRTPNLAS